jgi:hypothetical protein
MQVPFVHFFQIRFNNKTGKEALNNNRKNKLEKLQHSDSSDRRKKSRYDILRSDDLKNDDGRWLKQPATAKTSASTITMHGKNTVHNVSPTDK